MTGEIRQVRMPAEQAKAYALAVDWFIDKDVDLFDARYGRAYLTMLSMHAATTAEFTPEKFRMTMRIRGSKLIVCRQVTRTAQVPTLLITMSGQLIDLIRSDARHLVAPHTGRLRVIQADHQKRSRQATALKAFTTGEAMVLALSSRVGVGTDLSHAQEAIFLQRSWSETENQWVQNMLSPDCRIITYVSEGTVEVHQHHGFDRLGQIVGTTEEDRRSFLLGQPLQRG